MQRCFKLSSWFAKSRGLHDKARLENAGTLASLLKSRAVIRFQGPDTVKFLQGLLTNDVRRFGEGLSHKSSTLVTPNLSSETIPPIYAALLTPQGRFLYDFVLYGMPRSHEKLNRNHEPLQVFADVDASALDELLSTLNKYRLRAKVDIENVAEELHCWQRFGANLSENTNSVEEPEAASVGWGGGVHRSGMSASRGESFGWQWFKDPRLDCLGFRGIFPAKTTPPLVEADKETDEKNYLQWRIVNGVAEGSIEIPKGEAVPLEYNLVALNAISFDKGCYVGQELVARTHHRGVIRKRLLPLKFYKEDGEEAEQEVAPGSEVIETGSDKKIGTVTTQLGSRGLGVLRLGEAFKASSKLTIRGQNDVRVEASRPNWWPPEWLEEHHHHSAAA